MSPVLSVAAARSALLGLLLMAASLCVPLTAQAWKYHEHRSVGAESYTRACLKLGEDLDADLKAIDARAKTCTTEPCKAEVHAARIKLEPAMLLVSELLCKDRVVLARA